MSFETPLESSLPARLAASLQQLSASPDDRFLVAFSGGPDSSALAAALTRLPAPWCPKIVLCHVDHGLDSGSGARADQAEALATGLGLPLRRRTVASRLPDGESLEAWARRRRYEILGREFEVLDSDDTCRAWILTAHHAEDQAETLILRLAFGTGWVGLAGIRPRRGKILRPMLKERRETLTKFIHGLGLEPVDDPTNMDLDRPRNRIRHGVLPEWNSRRPDLVETLGRVAEASQRATRSLDARLGPRVDLRRDDDGDSVSMSVSELAALPSCLRRYALGMMDRSASRPYPSSPGARGELLAQLDGKRHGGVGCDAGHGRRWQGDGTRLRLLPPLTQPLADFTYTLEAPGTLDVPVLGARLSVELVSGREKFQAGSKTASDHLLFVPAQRFEGVAGPPRIEVRNRRPGDRIRLRGGSKKVKDLLIDRKIPRHLRSRVPLVTVDGHLMWIPGIAVDESFQASRAATGVRLFRWIETTLASGSQPDNGDEATVDIHPPAPEAGDGKKGS